MDNEGDRSNSRRQDRADGRSGRSVAGKVRATGSSVQRWIQEHPLAVGAMALAAGAAVGLSIRRTQVEDAAIGEARDSLVDRVAGTARDSAMS